MDPSTVPGTDPDAIQNIKTIDVDASGTKLSYLDSGPPVGTAPYKTTFIVHGIIFTNAIFQKVLKLAPASGLRIVAINRRDYPDSSPFSPAEISTMATGSDEDKAAFLSSLGLETMIFVDKFIQQHDLPPISSDGENGGVALAGWSLGSVVTCAAISSAARLSSDIKFRLAKYFRALILQDPPTVALGLPPRSTWSPSYDPQMPVKERFEHTCQWLTGYYKHGALDTRDPEVLSAYPASTHRAPSIFSMHSALSEILYPPPVSGSDGLFLKGNFGPQLLANYRKACFDPDTRVLLPKMKVWELCFDATIPNCIFALWDIQDDDAAHGGNLVNFEVVHGANHFMHWDDPSEMIEIYKKVVA